MFMEEKDQKGGGSVYGLEPRMRQGQGGEEASEIPPMASTSGAKAVVLRRGH